MTTSEKRSLTGPEIVMVVFSHKKQEDSLKNNFVTVEKKFRYLYEVQQKTQILKYLKTELVYVGLQSSSKP